MKRFNIQQGLLLATLAVAGFAAATSAQASTTTSKLRQCDGSRGEVMRCCEAAIRDASTMWRRSHETSCKQLVVCKAKGGKSDCLVKKYIPYVPPGGGGDTPKPPAGGTSTGGGGFAGKP